MVRQPRSLGQMVGVGVWAVQERDCPSGDVRTARRCVGVIRDQFSGLVALSAPNRDQPSARSTTTDTKWGLITPNTRRNRGYDCKNPPNQGQNPPKQGQNLPKTGYLQIGTAPAAHSVRCEANATHKAWTTIPSDVSGGHDRQGFIRVTVSSGNDPVCRTRPREWRWGSSPTLAEIACPRGLKPRRRSSRGKRGGRWHP